MRILRSAQSSATARPSGLRIAGGWLHGQRRRVATVAVAALTLGIGYHVVFGHNGLIAYSQKRQNARDLAAEVKNLQRENEALRGHVDRLQNDPSAIEHQAREELHYTRPGEVIVTLPPDPAPTTSVTAAKTASKN